MTPSYADTVMAAIRGRRSVRAYEGRYLDEETVLSIIDAGIHAPTTLGLQPWKFVVVRDHDLMKRISDFCKPVLLLNLKDRTDAESDVFKKMLESKEFNIFYNAAVLVLVVGDERNRFSTYDCTLCAGNMMLAAHAIGIGSCWIGAIEPVTGSPDLMQELKIPEGYRIVAPVVFGYPKEEPEKPPRRAPEIVWVR
ncbi:nitroreductase family protein [Methanofollis fontis]|uniref:Nitroreductase n=1 Tax=Methanofollis fontis TaxID=2052832 RepID=A0A483CMN6_9EURY|nr:nitroreductase family protein [Methanofollis fontis]TAJ44229.1 nitroreductase [Methanofollis fontis]